MRSKRWLAVGIVVVVIAVVAVIAWPKHKEPLVPAASATDCKRQLERLRVQVTEYYEKNGKYPKELFDPAKCVGVPDEYKCPACGRNYVYNPERWPDKLVICTLEEHRDF